MPTMTASRAASVAPDSGCFAAAAQGDFQEAAAQKLVEDDDRDHHGGKAVAQRRKLHGDLARQAEGNAGLGDQTKPGVALEGAGFAGQRAADAGAEQDAAAAQGKKRQRNGPGFGQQVQFDRDAGQGKEGDVDCRAHVMEHVGESVAMGRVKLVT